MELRAAVHVGADLVINDEEAEVIYHLTSYELGKVFFEKCSRKYDAEKIGSTLAKLHKATARIMAAKSAAQAAILAANKAA